MCAPPRRPHQHPHPRVSRPGPGPAPDRPTLTNPAPAQPRSGPGLANADQPGPDPAQGRVPRRTGHTPRPRTPRPPSTGHVSPDRSCNSRPGVRCHIDGRQSHDRSTTRRAGRPGGGSARRPARRTTSPDLEVPLVPISRCHFPRSRGVTSLELEVPQVPISGCHFPRSRGVISPDLEVPFVPISREVGRVRGGWERRGEPARWRPSRPVSVLLAGPPWRSRSSREAGLDVLRRRTGPPRHE
ncbi:Uncharacterised protein [Actinomyces howellii]|uniref:Uncharacterized protein n=1 Tax=Actinomyces howellii TaxID=52771 RepID=A0A3S4R9C2_9ACTO|nr:Uncharacterised protein [Actinomyces howellii]